MAKLSAEVVVAAALELLDEVGLDAVSTRGIAARLAVEQPSLYWHFRNKRELLAAMAKAAMAPHDAQPLPVPGDDWRDWFAENSRSFRRALLAHRDGARLHAGTTPQGDELSRALRKFQFLTAAGVPDAAARAGMLTSSQFTIGSVLEEQASGAQNNGAPDAGFDHDSAFEAGLGLIVAGLERRVPTI